jgi:penicillin-binding protein 1B
MKVPFQFSGPRRSRSGDLSRLSAVCTGVKSLPSRLKHISKRARKRLDWRKLAAGRAFRIFAVAGGVSLLAGLLTFTYFYVKYSRLIDERLAGGAFTHTSMIFAGPKRVSAGDVSTYTEIVEYLRRCGYSTHPENRLGWYRLGNDSLEIHPGPESYFAREAASIRLEGERVVEILSLEDRIPRPHYLLEPELITNLFDRNREKRRLVQFREIPKVLVNAVVSIEDKRFFQHAGFDPIRILKAAYVDLRVGRIEEGASTLTMQLAGSLWLDRRQRTWERKLLETLMTLHLERKLSKEEIFEFYANEIYLGRRGSFAIHGFGAGAQAFFGKDLGDLSLPEAATLAGIIQRPAVYDPYRNPDRAVARRNVVLSAMRAGGYITPQEFEEASKAPLRLAEGGIETTDAPYFVDLVNRELQNTLSEHDFQADAYRVYTTLDLDLQRAAAEAVEIGMKQVDELLRKQRRFRNVEDPGAQVALVALDPRTGEIKALIGGRNYGKSQLNRALARRQPGSVFKPFVFAASFNTVLEGGSPYLFNPVTTIIDEPTTFWFNEQPYEPSNHNNKTYGEVTLRYALAHSINIPTVKLAEMVGYDKVADLARRAGAGRDVLATPAMALGAYEATPIDMAGAYTVFANRGEHVAPRYIRAVRDSEGSLVREYRPVAEQVLDPRVAYLMVNLMEDVMQTGTGVRVRAAGFTLPAAGKTGTSRDGWFAGFTSKLICTVWVGFDDNSELYLEGAHSALPIWTEFMKRAHQYREYRNPAPFEPPSGIVRVEVDPATGQLATLSCPRVQSEVFIAGSQPIESCPLHRGPGLGGTHVAGWDATSEEPVVVASTQPSPRKAPARAEVPAELPASPSTTGQPVPAKERKSIFRRIFDIFK